MNEPPVDKPRAYTTYAKPVPVVKAAPPETATKRVKPPQKRGRKGNNIITALLAVSLFPEPAQEFAEKHGVSIAVLRQSKRFISAMEPSIANIIGKINVRQDKETKVLMIWRDSKDQDDITN